MDQRSGHGGSRAEICSGLLFLVLRTEGSCSKIEDSSPFDVVIANSLDEQCRGARIERRLKELMEADEVSNGVSRFAGKQPRNSQMFRRNAVKE